MSPALPLYERFKTPSGHYIYDAYSNEILSISRAAWEICDDYLSGIPIRANGSLTAAEIEGAIADLVEGQRNGYLHPCEVQSMSFYDGSHGAVIRAVTSRLSQLSLEVTEACNNRCKYCAFTYSPKRTQAPSTMQPQTAINALELFFRHSADTNAKARAITFWGGEPLLNYPLIKTVTQWVAQHHADERIKYAFTTNGTLLTDEHASFLAENDFLLTVSLDGPRPTHDRNRIAVGGQGTFDRVLEGLGRIKARHEQYYCTKVSFHCVITPGTSLSELISFFEGDMCRGHLIKATIVSNAGTPFEATLSPGQFGELAKAYETAAVRGGEMAIVRELFDPRMILITRRSREKLGKTILPNGCCVPLMRSLHVAVDGSIHLCEKVDHSSPLGNVNESGIDLPAVLRLVELYATNSLAACQSCFALRLCGLCYQGSVHGHAWRPDSPSRCELERAGVRRSLERYAGILEENPCAFDAFWKQEVTAPM